MTAQELIQTRIGELEKSAKFSLSNALDSRKDAEAHEAHAAAAEAQITELKAALDTLNDPIKIERKKAAAKK